MPTDVLLNGVCSHWHLTVASWTFLESDCKHMKDAHSVMPDIHSAWNVLRGSLKNNTLSLSTFRRQLKHCYFSHY